MTVTELRPRADRAVHAPAPRHRRRPVLDLCLAVASGLAVAVTVARGLGRYPAVGGDEGIYTEQAWAVLHGRLTPYTYTYDHPFLGWLQLSLPDQAVQWLHRGRGLAVVDSRAVMVGYAFATAMLVFGIARRLGMRRPTAVIAVGAMGLSPLYVVEARQVLLDNVGTPWMLLALFLVLSPRQRQWSYGLAGLALAVGVLSKETLLLFVPAIGFALWQRCFPPLRSMAMTLFGGMLILSTAAHPLFALLRGELLPGPNHVSIWTNEIEYQLLDRVGSGALWDPGSGRAALVEQWLSYDRWLLCLGALAALGCLVPRELRVVGVGFVLFSLPILKPGGYLPAMYVIAGLPFAGLATAGVLDAAYSRLARATLVRPPGPRLRSWGQILLIAVVTLPLSVSTATAYVRHERTIRETDLVTADSQALAYVDTHVSRRARVLTDDGFWVDLVHAGFSSDGWDGPVSYYRFDLDPLTSGTRLPQGWRDIDYVVATREMRLVGPAFTRTRATFAHATVIASFGAGQDRIEVLRVRRTAYNAAGLPPVPTPAASRVRAAKAAGSLSEAVPDLIASVPRSTVDPGEN